MDRPADDRTGPAARASLVAISAALGNAVLFESLTLLETQDRAVRVASPWQNDPYNTMVSFAVFTVPMICLVVAMRLTVWRQPGESDRAQQTLRAIAMATCIVAVTLAVEWAAVGLRAHRNAWDARTGWLISGLATSTIFTAWVVIRLARTGVLRRHGRAWEHDWLGDMVQAGSAVPLLRQWVTPRRAEWVRQHAVSVFASVSLCGSLVVIAALAVGERWTNPLLIAWAVAVETTSNFAFCIISNAIAGFIARPARGTSRRRLELATLAGFVAVQLAVAFHTALWRGLGGSDLSSVVDLVALTFGAGLFAWVLTFALVRPSGPSHAR